MSASKNFDTILELRLSGNLAHFRKFYTNASSLSYTIPPRTAICGLVASILMLP
ncbi:MAG: CRISPR-associated protein Cas5, partial [Candidatus Cloacimonetes bacterium]|nr:CRISPR-associated protein Cas5 [Candidatus Cloacimonadota bacterium]